MLSSLLEVLTVILVAAEVRQRLSVSKWAAQNFNMETFNLKKMNDVAVKEQHQVKIPERFAALENLDDDDDDDDDDDVDINRACESIRI